MSLSVLLVVPIREGANVQIAPDAGVLYLGTALQNKGFKVTMLDCSKEGLTFRDFKTFLESKHFDVVGFRCYSRDHNYVSHHLRIVRQVLPQALTLVGGPHPSALPEFVLDSMPALDFAWKAEAEEGLPQLLSYFREYGKEIPEADLQKIPGLVWRNTKTQTIVVNPPGFVTSNCAACINAGTSSVQPSTRSDEDGLTRNSCSRRCAPRSRPAIAIMWSGALKSANARATSSMRVGPMPPPIKSTIGKSSVIP